MNIKVKTFTNEPFFIEANPNETVKELKEKIEKLKLFTVVSQKLFYDSRLLDDLRTVADLNLEPSKPIVLLISTPSTFKEPQRNEKVPTPQVVVPEMVVVKLMEMGFERSNVLEALKAISNDKDQTIEYLVTSIPKEPQFASALKPDAESEPEEDINPFDYLRAHPIVKNIRRRVQLDPACLADMIQETGQKCPDILKIIDDYQSQFADLLTEPIYPNESFDEVVKIENSPPLDTVLHDYNLDDYDGEIMKKMVAMGFPEQNVLVAYTACDKNEEAMVDFLIEKQELKKKR